MARQRRVFGVSAGSVAPRDGGGSAAVPAVVPETALGSLNSVPVSVIADDGVPLHVEVDELPAGVTDSPLTVVFVHGFVMSVHCWHYQRMHYRGHYRAVLYDQRSHGRSGRSPVTHVTIEQLGKDLERVLHDVTHDDPVVVIGHSMGGMTILSWAAQFPEQVGSKVVGVGLVGTTAGGLDPGRILFPAVPAGLGGGLVGRVVGTLSRSHRAVDRVRGLSSNFARQAVDNYAFGKDVARDLVDFTYTLIDATPFEVVANFYPVIATVDLWDGIAALSAVPTSIICGTEDRLTAIGHSRKLHARIHGSELLECEDAGHMVMMERPVDVNNELDHLISRATAVIQSR